MPVSSRNMNDQDRKWAFVGAMSRKDLETLAAAVIEQLCMTAGAFDTHVDWNGAEVCDELSTVLGNLGVSYSTLLAAKQAKPPPAKGKSVTAMRDALLDFVSTIETTGGIQSDPEGPGTDVPVGDTEWVDLAESYKAACAALGRAPKRTDNRNDEEDDV